MRTGLHWLPALVFGLGIGAVAGAVAVSTISDQRVVARIDHQVITRVTMVMSDNQHQVHDPDNHHLFQPPQC
ncbi:MAG TPA: hypothetical protein VGK74_12725 [Symbiobacteriaceae bacterium]|jgi:hypothetical protein